MKHSTHFNEKSYENKMLQRQIRMINFDLDAVKNFIADKRKFLKDYIDNKDIAYKKFRTK